MNITMSEAEIVALFETLGLGSEQERQQVLYSLTPAVTPKRVEDLRFDIGFNAEFPQK